MMGLPPQNWQAQLPGVLPHQEGCPKEVFALVTPGMGLRMFLKIGCLFRLPSHLKNCRRDSSISWQVRREPEGINTAVKENDISSLSREVYNETASSSGAKQRRTVRKESRIVSLIICADLAQEISRTASMVKNGFSTLSFEDVEKFKYLGATVTNMNDTREEIKRRINMGNPCYYSVEKLLSSSLLSKNLKVRIYKTVTLPVVLYGCKTWILTLREEQRLRVFENKVLRKIFGAQRDEVTEKWRMLHNAELHALYSSPGIIRNIKSRCLRWAGHVAHRAWSIPVSVANSCRDYRLSFSKHCSIAARATSVRTVLRRPVRGLSVLFTRPFWKAAAHLATVLYGRARPPTASKSCANLTYSRRSNREDEEEILKRSRRGDVKEKTEKEQER
ncbi:hypothetical protein ANN_26992 [Periplaneta americana]|uniref:Reverse transcriptase n=1 Tax=Periplaneta americana TaxID=6978 RepID=A0ABQ8RWX5_PERAM|nr:hypothetical protein ANN_26992 [Periplaneta americana]